MVEMHCGYDTGRLYKQHYGHALSSAGKAQEKYNYKRGIKNIYHTWTRLYGRKYFKTNTAKSWTNRI